MINSKVLIGGKLKSTLTNEQLKLLKFLEKLKDPYPGLSFVQFDCISQKPLKFYTNHVGKLIFVATRFGNYGLLQVSTVGMAETLHECDLAKKIKALHLRDRINQLAMPTHFPIIETLADVEFLEEFKQQMKETKWKSGASFDGHPAPPVQFFKQTPLKSLEWFQAIVKHPAPIIFFFNDAAECGMVTIRDEEHILEMLEAQKKGYKFLKLVERAKQAVPFPFDGEE